MRITCFIRYQVDPFQKEPEGRANFAFAEQHRLILREERSFLRDVTLGEPGEMTRRTSVFVREGVHDDG